jgi:hypothetical protein
VKLGGRVCPNPDDRPPDGVASALSAPESNPRRFGVDFCDPSVLKNRRGGAQPREDESRVLLTDGAWLDSCAACGGAVIRIKS